MTWPAALATKRDDIYRIVSSYPEPVPAEEILLEYNKMLYAKYGQTIIDIQYIKTTLDDLGQHHAIVVYNTNYILTNRIKIDYEKWAIKFNRPFSNRDKYFNVPLAFRWSTFVKKLAEAQAYQKFKRNNPSRH